MQYRTFRGLTWLSRLSCLMLLSHAACSSSGGGNGGVNANGGAGGDGTGGDGNGSGGAGPGSGGSVGTGAAGGTNNGGAAANPDAGAQGGSPGAGGNGRLDAAPAIDATGDDLMPAGYKPSMIAVGYGGVRVLSRDIGLTWGNRSQIAPANGTVDDGNILRTATYGMGMYVAAGVFIFTSPDGITWTERVNGMNNEINGVTFGNGIFVGAGGCSRTVRSVDGVNWVRAGNTVPGNCPSGSLREIAFGNGKFAVAGDSGIAYTSTDAMKWDVLPGLGSGGIAFCNGAFHKKTDCFMACDQSLRCLGYGHGVYLRANNLGGGSIERSLDAKKWNLVYKDASTFYGDVFAFGYSPP